MLDEQSALANFSFLWPGVLAGMAYPRQPGALAELVRLGFRSLVTLTASRPAVGQSLLQLHCPVPDFARIPPLWLQRAVAFVRRAPGPVVVHCQGGVGRTGTVLACCLVAQGIKAEDALAQVREARPGSIDDPELEESVRDYARFLQAQHWNPDEAPFNFAPASELDPLVHGAERPGYRGRSPIGPERVADWVAFLQRQGIRRVLCLLDAAHLQRYVPALLPALAERFAVVDSLPVADYQLPDRETLKLALTALAEAEQAQEPVVVHCSAGLGRTGFLLAAWLVWRHGLSAAQAMAHVRRHAAWFGASRAPGEAGGAAAEWLARLPELVPRSAPPIR